MEGRDIALWFDGAGPSSPERVVEDVPQGGIAAPVASVLPDGEVAVGEVAVGEVAVVAGLGDDAPSAVRVVA